MTRKVAAVVLVCLLLPCCAQAQSTDATITGRISDPSKAAIPGAKVIVTNVDTGVQQSGTTGSDGFYTIVALKPGNYKMEVEKQGFRTVVKPDVVLHVQDAPTINFEMAVGTVSESVTVEGGAPLINTQDAAVSTVVDRQFAENLPLNGRSFQTLIQLTPGVVLTTSNLEDGGQFSVNGQRPSSNYWMVDGVSANIGASPYGVPGNGFAGSLGSFSALGGTNSLVSVDALQEFRIQTSTYAPEFGRTPGGQISIVTRSGTNQFHGTMFDYLRNDVLDASDWFNGFTNNPPLPKAKERQNDFGGTFAGPINKDKTFFFFSYEGLRLRLPQTALTTVPDLNARQTAAPAMQPFLNAFPFDPNQPDLGNGIAQFNASFSNPASLDAYSIRVDHRLSSKLTLFGRYNYSPSHIELRGVNGSSALSEVEPVRIVTQTGTAGTTWLVSPAITNDFRFNYSRTNASSHSFLDTFGGAVPLSSLPLPSPFTAQDASVRLDIPGLKGSFLSEGELARQLQQQINIVDNLSLQKGTHNLKFGIDFRRLSPEHTPALYSQFGLFSNVLSAKAGKLLFSEVFSSLDATILLRNLGAFAQDTWRIAPRLTITYGLRWDVDFAPSSISGPNFAAVTGFNINDLSNLALAPTGTPPFKTTYGNVAPRIGAAYQISQSPDWGTVFRGGFGVFYDLATSEAGNLITINRFPFGGFRFKSGGTFPLDPATAAPPAITSSAGINAFDPNEELPYVLQWNVALEQALGKQQTITASYIGAVGRKLIQTTFISLPSPNFNSANLTTNAGTSDYNALQVQFQRRLSRGLQALASYTWSHSIDTGSAGSGQIASNQLVPSNANRGPSDFDIRNAFSTGLTYEFPAPKINAFTDSILRGWSVESVIQARSAPPVDITDANFSGAFNSGFSGDVRPDVVAGQPLYLFGSQCVPVFGSQCPGGRGFNPGAFTDPPTDPNTFNPLRQGTLPRNALRAFSAVQWDFAVHRDFPIHESLMLQFRAEMFNVLNHPNFGPPFNQFGAGGFGLSNQMLGQSLNSNNLGGGAFSPLYQIGGPRSIQLGLKLVF
jgi:hypothetical protein